MTAFHLSMLPTHPNEVRTLAKLLHALATRAAQTLNSTPPALNPKPLRSKP